MYHWTDPRERGVYSHPAAIPPEPRPHTSNDLGARVASLENHVRWSNYDRQRVEMESRERARELGNGIVALQQDIHRRLTVIEQERHTRKVLWKFAMISGSSALKFVRFAVAGLIALLMVGKVISPEVAKILGLWLGFPAG